jgi:hypothetical protein
MVGPTPSESSRLRALAVPGSRMSTYVVRSLAGALLLVAVSLPGCRPKAGACAKGDETVVACVDGVAVSRATAEEFTEEPWWVAGSPELPDARKVAVDRAVRAQLFAAEAKRRGLPLPAGQPDVTATWSRVLVTSEMTTRGITRESISDDEATKHYAANREMFNQIDKVDAQVIVFDDAKKATAVYAEAAAADEAGFKALVLKHSIDEKTRAQGGDRVLIASTDEDAAVLKMVLTLRKPGVVGGPFKGSDGRWYLVRIKASPVEHPRPLDESLKLTVKNALVDQRRRALMDELEKKLRGSASIEIVDAAVAKINPARRKN